MKIKSFLFLTFVVLAGVICFGISKRNTYTDISADPSYLNEIYVAQIPEMICMEECKRLKEELPTASVIAKVIALEDVEHLGQSSRQLVKVETVYQGTELEAGQEIYLTFYRWSLSLEVQPNSLERGFVNVMETGEEYLVFIEDQADGLGGDIPVYDLYGGGVIAPIFSYREHEAKIVTDMVPGSTYVLYDQVRDNEFFASTETAMEAIQKLKKGLMEKYK